MTCLEPQSGSVAELKGAHWDCLHCSQSYNSDPNKKCHPGSARDLPSPACSLSPTAARAGMGHFCSDQVQDPALPLPLPPLQGSEETSLHPHVV